MIDTEVLVDLMKRVMSKEQLRQLVKDHSEAKHDGRCLLCGEKDVPVDYDGNFVCADEAEAWREMHTDNCPIARIETHLFQELGREQ